MGATGWTCDQCRDPCEVVSRTLTGLQSKQKMEGMVRWSRAFASVLVVCGVLTSTWTTCAQGAIASRTEQMACCRAGHDDCPMTDSAADCCAKSGPQIPSQGTVVKVASFSAPALALLVWATLPPMALAAQSHRRVSYVFSPPGLLVAPPAYIAFSSLLI